MQAFFATVRMCVRSRGEFGLMNTLGQYLLKLIALAAQWMVWRAVLPPGATVDGMNRQNMLVYITVSSALAPLLDVRTPASSWLHDGTMLGLFQRPSSIYGQLAAHAAGGWLLPLALYGAPLLAIASLLGFPPLPASPWFFPSLARCVAQGFATDYLFACLMIRMNNAEWAMESLRSALTALLTGALIPFAALPGGNRKLAGAVAAGYPGGRSAGADGGPGRADSTAGRAGILESDAVAAGAIRLQGLAGKDGVLWRLSSGSWEGCTRSMPGWTGSC